MLAGECLLLLRLVYFLQYHAKTLARKKVSGMTYLVSSGPLLTPSLRTHACGCFADTQCSGKPCQNGGICTSKSTSSTSTPKYSCKCVDGYSGNNCESKSHQRAWYHRSGTKNKSTRYVYVSVSEQHVLEWLTFDLDIWNVVSVRLCHFRKPELTVYMMTKCCPFRYECTLLHNIFLVVC